MLREDGRPAQVACAAGNSNVLMAPSGQQICSGMHQLNAAQHNIMTGSSLYGLRNQAKTTTSGLCSEKDSFCFSCASQYAASVDIRSRDYQDPTHDRLVYHTIISRSSSSFVVNNMNGTSGCKNPRRWLDNRQQLQRSLPQYCTAA